MEQTKLTVIIVNYNVKHFLEQCLIACLRASHGMSIELMVVDNHSMDGSVEMVRKKFPEVKLIASPNNLGFSKGNNLGIKQAKGTYILLLNPDTIVEEDTFSKVVDFMDEHPDAGGLGVKMIDGKGRFLPESKRGLPTPSVAFYKMFGLSSIFPNSRKFGQYHLTYLDKDKTHEVDVLSGAFMLLRKSVLDKIGWLDETFFMYGEDIDLSYRIQLAGYKNYYYADTSIIHYKGESTKKTSINYVFVFYRAMVIFAQKHFSKSNARLFGLLINIAIYFRAGITLLTNFVRESYLSIIDYLLILLGVIGCVYLYQDQTGIYPPTDVLRVLLPAYAFIWVTGALFGGAYDRPHLQLNFIKGTIIGTGLILVVYALLPESYRFSRAIIFLGTLSTIFLGVGARFLLDRTGLFGFRLGNIRKRRFAIVGDLIEIDRVLKLLTQTTLKPDFVARVAIDPIEIQDEQYVGHVNQLRDITRIFGIEEVIFCAENIEASRIIKLMAQLDNEQLDYKIAPPESLFVIGSNSINSSGELYSILNINAISKPKNLRLKRLFDIMFTLLCFVLLPVFMLLVKKRITFLGNLFSVLLGEMSWVGYDSRGNNLYDLPMIKKGVLSLAKLTGKEEQEEIAQINTMYAKDYNIINDFQVIVRGYQQLGG